MPYFNSIKVRLEQLLPLGGGVGEPHFNSIKVRLEHNDRKNDRAIIVISIP